MTDTSPFDDLDAYVAVPRLAGLVLSVDGRRLVAPVQTLSSDGRRYVTALWGIDPDGGPARRLTWSAPGEQAPVFLADGDLLFVSSRPDPAGTDKADDERAALWRLPATGGEAEPVVVRRGGVVRAVAARAAGAVVVQASVLGGPAEGDDDRRTARKDAGVTAVLYERLPVRHWDHDLGPGSDRLLAVDGADRDGPFALRDLTPDADGALDLAEADLAPDGTVVVTTWRVTHPGGRESSRLVEIDLATGDRRLLAATDEQADGQHDYEAPAVSPDGRLVVFVDTAVESPERAPSVTLGLVDRQTGERRDLLPSFPYWPASPVWSPDGAAVYFVADEAGHCPVFRVELAGGTVTRLSASGAYSELCPSPDGRFVYALRSHVDSPARPVRLDADDVDQQPTELAAPGGVGPLPGRLEEVEAMAADGTPVRGWLVLPDLDGPAPLLLWVHGGPLMSWLGWSWRWNPWLMAARGWAVLLPDPGLSQGYGDAMVQRAWGQWGPVPFADLMAITDAVEQRDDVDASRTAAMGGSYGGYMANWIAGHTERFKAIVTHASLWSLHSFAGTTDHPGSWALEFGHPDDHPELYERNSPHLHAASIRTPMLVIHGDKDYRVPVGEGLALWSDLVRHQVDAKLLYFPDEGHWILKPGNVKAWYEAVTAFLDHHVRGGDWVPPTHC